MFWISEENLKHGSANRQTKIKSRWRRNRSIRRQIQTLRAQIPKQAAFRVNQRTQRLERDFDGKSEVLQRCGREEVRRSRIKNDEENIAGHEEGQKVNSLSVNPVYKGHIEDEIVQYWVILLGSWSRTCEKPTNYSKGSTLNKTTPSTRLNNSWIPWKTYKSN